MTMRKPTLRRQRFAVGIVLAAALSGSAAVPARAASKSLNPPALVPGGKAPDLTLIGTGDVIGYLEPCG